MWTCGFMLSISVALTLSSQLYTGNGWVPMTSDVVYNQIKHGIRIPQFTKPDDGQVHSDARHLVTNHRGLEDIKQGSISNHRELEDIKKGSISSHRGLEDIKQGYVYNHQGFPNIKTKPFTSEEIDYFNNDKESTLGYDVLNNKTSSPYKNNFLPLPPLNHQEEKIDVTVRRSKKLADIDSQVTLNYIMLPKNDKPKNFLKKENEEELSKNSTHTYEVIEDTSLEDEKQEESKANENGYEYTKPMKQNFNNDLTKYLSKYNINDNDNLQNYALSRQPKADNRMFRNHRHKPILIQVPARYNSLNHLPVDPLLAVFLSNYGHYLQGQYGISNNYNNLYGYLASNNIHNNRPFGFYKLFSDTDSSNR